MDVPLALKIERIKWMWVYILDFMLHRMCVLLSVGRPEGGHTELGDGGGDVDALGEEPKGHEVVADEGVVPVDEVRDALDDRVPLGEEASDPKGRGTRME